MARIEIRPISLSLLSGGSQLGCTRSRSASNPTQMSNPRGGAMRNKGNRLPGRPVGDAHPSLANSRREDF